MQKSPPVDVDAYIAGFPPAVQERLHAMRSTIRAAAPEATEAIRYQMPAYEMAGVLVYFAAFKNHVGFYATPTGNAAFAAALAAYQVGKGSIQFPHNRPLPLDLVDAIVRFRVAENLKKAAAKSAKKTGA